MLDVEGEDFDDPDADAGLFESIREHPDEVELLELDSDINTDAFAERIAKKIDEYMHAVGGAPPK